ncbi:DUF5797 family protein [Salinirubellus salinus]|uniref:DUF5797 family protein n=1 Tax=Salinirubellus salinus TaxID=1364945 RepID=A0A9E7UBN7_9EURY|nr:DUF5797 family protein [Salinirubellus salinus]UWM55277.1 DUF5797 family protein [Salinirubellus salinus]
MELSEEAKSRLADVVTLQPTKNAELQERWGMESGSEVHRYLENELKEYYYRDENSLIRATAEAAELVDVEPGIEDDGEGGAPSVLRVPDLQYHVLAVVPDSGEDSISVVATLQRLREETDLDPEVDDVRAALRSLANKGALETVKRTVPTYRLAVARDSLTVELAA